MSVINERLEKGKILPLVFKLTMPAVVAQLISFLYNIVDRMFVAKISGIETEALAALGIVLPITLIVQAFANLIGLGGSPLASIRMGEGNKEEANKLFNSSFILLAIIGFLLSIVIFIFAEDIIRLFKCPEAAVEYATSYLKVYSFGTIFVILSQGLNPFITAQGYSFIAMSSVLIGALMNIALDPLFIFGFNMKVAGANFATILSQLISFVWIVAFFFTKKSGFKIKINNMKLQFRRVFKIISLGFSPFIMLLTECAIQIVFNYNLSVTTNGNENYTAALTIMLSALQFISLPLNGIGYGIQPFVSYNYGRGDSKRVKEGIKYVTIIAFIFAAVVYTLSMSFPQMYTFIFSAKPDVRIIVIKYMPLFLMGTIMFFIQMTLQNINIALGQTTTALILAVLRKVIILIPLCFILANTIGFKGVYLSEGIADLAAGIITGIVIFITLPRALKKRELEVQNNNLSINS